MGKIQKDFQKSLDQINKDLAEINKLEMDIAGIISNLEQMGKSIYIVSPDMLDTLTDNPTTETTDTPETTPEKTTKQKRKKKNTLETEPASAPETETIQADETGEQENEPPWDNQ